MNPALRRQRYRGLARQRRLHRAWSLLKSISILSILAGGAYAVTLYVSESPRFQVRHIQVEGVHTLRPEDIVAAAGIRSTDNLLLLDIAGIRRRIKALPYVKHCEVFRAYPDTALLRIEERSAKAILLVENHAFELDEEGIVLRELSAKLAAGFPIITNVPGVAFPSEGQRLDAPALLAALKLWDALKDSPVVQELTLSEISAESEDQLRVFFDELPFETIWGRSDFEAEVLRFSVLWREKQGQLPCKESLDMRFDENLVCR